MPPRKKVSASSGSSTPLPAPNPAHPSAKLIQHALSKSSRPHPPSYHSFITSPFFPESQSVSGNGKKRSAAAAPGLVAPVAGSWEASTLHRKLLAWFDTVSSSRGMPWRKDVDVKQLRGEAKTQRGYEVWVSETMLQQTQVATVIPYFERWMAKFPTVAALAGSDIESINAVWAGLGYYSRASRLLKGAQTVIRDFDGRIPERKDELEQVDGIGPYTAGAISSIAFGQRAPLVDGNVIRVLSRLTAMHAPQMAKPSTNYIWALADVLVPAYGAELDVGGPNKCGAWNQALMELGATVCTPKNARCGDCPLSEECLAYAEVRALAHPRPREETATPAAIVDVEDLCELCEPAAVSRELGVTLYPMAKERKKAREEETGVCVFEWESSVAEEGAPRQVLIVKRPEKGLLAGLFEFPAVDLPPADELSTAPVRRRYLEKLVNSLVDERIPAFAQPEASSAATADSTAAHLRVKEVRDLGSITQVYSHQKREYHILRVVLTSPALPALKGPRTREPREGDLVQSVPGRAKWVDEGVLAESNLGGAMLKVLDVREKGAKLKPAAKKVEKKVEKGLVGLGSWLVKKKAEVDEVKVVAAAEVSLSTDYKKRRIVLSDEDD